MTQVAIRQPKATDLNFIQATFLKSMKRESSLGRSCSNRVFFDQFPQVIDHILAESETIIACVKDEPDVILGYLIFDREQKVVHYAFVKAAFRRLEIAKEMIEHAFPNAKSLAFSQNTNSAKQIAKRHPELIFNPFVLYKKGA